MLATKGHIYHGAEKSLLNIFDWLEKIKES